MRTELGHTREKLEDDPPTSTSLQTRQPGPASTSPKTATALHSVNIYRAPSSTPDAVLGLGVRLYKGLLAKENAG